MCDITAQDKLAIVSFPCSAWLFVYKMLVYINKMFVFFGAATWIVCQIWRGDTTRTLTPTLQAWGHVAVGNYKHWCCLCDCKYRLCDKNSLNVIFCAQQSRFVLHHECVEKESAKWRPPTFCLTNYSYSLHRFKTKYSNDCLRWQGRSDIDWSQLDRRLLRVIRVEAQHIIIILLELLCNIILS